MKNIFNTGSYQVSSKVLTELVCDPFHKLNIDLFMCYIGPKSDRYQPLLLTN